jgi:serine/threonine protein kinase/formylglycine-generating enzyme required for sulfatase activity
MSSEPPISPDLIQRALRGELPDDQLEQVVAYWQAQPGNTPPDDSLADPLLDAVRDTLTIRDELTRVEADVAPLVERLVRTDLASPLAESPSDGTTSPQPASSEVTYAGPADSATIDASSAESGDGGATRSVVSLSSAGVTMGTPDPFVTVGPSLDPRALPASQSTRRDAGLATPVESELVPGLVLGAYKIIRKLGQGGMGLVFLAEHQRMERLVALKVLPPSVTKRYNAVERFHREVKAMARLSHPHIVTAFDADEARGLHFLVMEYVDGQDLAALVKKRGPLSVDQAVDYIVQGAKGLEYAHKRGLIHRDIKPSNFLVDTEGLVKILDLGLARFSKQADDGEGPPGMDLTGTGVVVGTVDYMSPEQAEDTKRADARADIYSLGCSLFYLISGRSMFSGDTVVARLMAHQNQPVPSLRSINPVVPEELDRIHRKMVAKKKDDRYQTATALLDDLRKLAPEAFAGQGPRFAPDAARPVNDEQTFVGPLSGSVTSGSTAIAEVTPASLSKALGAGMRPPGNKKLLVGAAAAALVLLMGWVIVFRDKDGKEVGRVEVPGAGPAVVQTANSGTATITRTGDASQPDQEAVNSATGSSRDGWQSWPADAPKLAIAPFDPAQAKQHQEEWAAYLKVPVEYANTIGMKLRLIPPGEFTMGSPAGEVGRSDNETQVSVTLTRAFQMSRTEVTQGQWRAVMGTEPWKGQSYVQEGDDYPATFVNWEEAVSFCEKLSANEGKGYRLPTEAEWEWACRAGSRTAYSFGGSEGDLGRYAWFNLNAWEVGEKYAHRVGQKLPNGFGLSDMYGNVWELCGDWYGEKLVGGSNPVGASSGSLRVARGGCWNLTAGICRSAHRSRFVPSYGDYFIGFRLALSPSGTKPPVVDGATKPLFFQTPGYEPWAKEVAAMPAEQQVDAVRKKLVELNPGFDGKVTPKIDNGVVTGLVFLTDKVTDISPVRALVGMNALSCSSIQYNGPLSDLSPLNKMPLTSLIFWNTKVSDLSPLEGMKLTNLVFVGSPVFDLSVLKGMPLESLNCNMSRVSELTPIKGMRLVSLSITATTVSDLAPLAGMPLTGLAVGSTQVSDLSVLEGMPLTDLYCNDAKVTNLSPLKGMSLTFLSCDFKPERDTELLRSIKTLETINNKPAAEFWKEVEEQQKGKKLGFQMPGFDQWVKDVAAMPAEQQVEAVSKKLVELNPGFDGNVTDLEMKGTPKIENGVVTEFGFLTAKVTDISPVRAFAGLKGLRCGDIEGENSLVGILADLSPLKGMLLTSLYCVANPQINDISPLAGMPLINLTLNWTNVGDLSSLRAMPLTRLHIGGLPISDLKPLASMDLKELDISYSKAVNDLTPLKTHSLRSISLVDTSVSDLSPLKGQPLHYLRCSKTRISDLSLIKAMPLWQLNLDFNPERDTDLLRSIKTLGMINGKPTAEFWKEVEEQKKGKKAGQ